MNFIVILGIAGCGVLLNRAILIYLRKKYTQQLIKAIQSRNETEYQRLVFSKSARILMEPNVVNLARASLYSRRKEDQAVSKDVGINTKTGIVFIAAGFLLHVVSELSS